MGRYKQTPKSRSSLKIDPLILEGIIRMILRRSDKDKIVALLPSLICELVASNAVDVIGALIKENVILDVNVGFTSYTRGVLSPFNSLNLTILFKFRYTFCFTSRYQTTT